MYKLNLHPHPIDVRILRELTGVMQNVSATQGLLVAWGGFTKDAIQEAKNLLENKILPINYYAFYSLIIILMKNLRVALLNNPIKKLSIRYHDNR